MVGLIKIFTQLGLEQEHAQLYIAGLAWGETSMTNLAEYAKIPRSSAYLLMKDLLKLGIFTKSVQRGQKNYIPCNPEYIKDLLAKKIFDLQKSIDKFSNNIMKELKAINNKAIKGKPKIMFLEGTEGIQQAYEMTFGAKDEVCIQCLTQTYGGVSEKWFYNYFDRFFLESDIPSREILAPSEDEWYTEKYSSKKNKQVRANIDYETNTDFMVFDNTVIFVSFDEKNPYALVIEDREITKAMKNLFNQAWKNLV